MHIRHAHHLFNDYVFQRGIEYVEWGMVRHRPQITPHVFDLVVEGTRAYGLNLAVDDVGHILSYKCDCLTEHCKHLAASIVYLSQRQLTQYQTTPKMVWKENLAEDILDVSLISTAIIEQLNNALEIARVDDSMDTLFEAYEYYMDQMHWLFEHDLSQQAVIVLEYVMDDMVSYWTSKNNDCVRMSFFDKQTGWIKKIIQSDHVDPLRSLSNILIWYQLYSEIPPRVIADWLVLAANLASDEHLYLDVVELIETILNEAPLNDVYADVRFALALARKDEQRVADLVSKYPQSILMRRYLIDKAIEQENWHEVIRLSREKIQSRPKYEDLIWVYDMLKAYENLQDRNGVLLTLRWLYYCGEPMALDHLKSLVDRRLWRLTVEEMITEYQHKAYSDWMYRDLLIKEQNWEFLLQYVKENPKLISQLHPYLVNLYPDFVYEYLKDWITMIYKRDQNLESLKPWIAIMTDYFGEEEGWKLIEFYQNKD